MASDIFDSLLQVRLYWILQFNGYRRSLVPRSLVHAYIIKKPKCIPKEKKIFIDDS